VVNRSKVKITLGGGECGSGKMSTLRACLVKPSRFARDGLTKQALNVGATAPYANVASDVDGLAGSRFADGVSRITGASVGISVGTLNNLFSISLSSSTNDITSIASVDWDGATTLTPAASSDLVRSATTLLTIRILGLNITIPAFNASGIANIAFDNFVLTSDTTLTGNISLTMNKTNTFFNGDVAHAEATSLGADINVHVNVVGLASVNLTADVAINKTTALVGAIEDVNSVPETGKTLAMLGASFTGLAFLRRRLA
jgi:hypothetical protein